MIFNFKWNGVIFIILLNRKFHFGNDVEVKLELLFLLMITDVRTDVRTYTSSSRAVMLSQLKNAVEEKID